MYTPVLKGSECDIKALGWIPRVYSNRVLPVIELLSPDEDESLEDCCAMLAERLRKFCPIQTVCLDLHAIAPNACTDGGLWGTGSPVLEEAFGYLRGLGVRFVPVFGFDHEPELWERIARVALAERRGIAFRLHVDDLEAGDDTLSQVLDLIDGAGIPGGQTNLILDLGSVRELDVAEISRLRDRVQDFTEAALNARSFRLISVVGSSMPKDVSDVNEDDMASVERRELLLWLDACTSLREKPLSFGDYGIVHPNFSLKNPATNANAKIRYTKGRHHHIFRGRSLKKFSYKQYHLLAHRVVNSEHYLHSGYSFGDDYMWRCSREEAGTGNLGTWVEVDMNHHMVYVADHLDQMVAKLAAGATIPEVLSAA
jgi:hypothetical protein